MNNKELLKKALENEMPDLETVREKCLTKQTIISKAKIFSFNNTTVKRIVPAVACLLIIVIAFATINFTQEPQNLIFNEINHNKTTKTTAEKNPNNKNKKKDKSKNEQQNYYYNNIYSEEITVVETTAQTTEDEIKNTLPAKNDLSKLTSVSYISFDSFSELCSIASTFDVKNSKVVFERDKLYILSIPATNLSMILENRIVYGFSVNGNTISNSGTLSNDFYNGLTGCKFYTSYNGNSYNIGYLTNGNAFGGDIIETVSSAQGYDFYYLGDGTYVSYINGFCFAIQDSNDNFEEAKNFIENLSIFSKSI